MTFEDVKFVLNIILEKQGIKTDLTDIQELVFRQSWKGKSYREIADESAYEHDYIRHIGSQLWQFISDATGKRVTKRNLHSVLKQYWQAQQEISTVQDWRETVNISIFCGRHRELTPLQQWIILNRCSLIATMGMKGVGKTDLSEKLAQQLSSEFEYALWRSLHDAPPILEMLTDLIKFLSNQQERDLPDTVAGQLSLLMRYLRQHRCLIVLDGFETVLNKGKSLDAYRPGYEGYGELLRRVGEVVHQSCFLVTRTTKRNGSI